MAKGETTLTSEEARRFSDLAWRVSKRLRALAKSAEDRELVEELEAMEQRLWHVEYQGRPHKIGTSRLTVGEALAIREKDGEAKMLRKLSGILSGDDEEDAKRMLVSRATFYRRLKVLKEYAAKTGEDLNQIEFWTIKC